VDGQLAASGTGGTASLTAPLQLRLGSLATGTNFFQGELDEVRLWNVARTADEISQSLVYPLSGSESNLVAYWKLDEGAGTTATSTTNGYPASLFGPEWTPSTLPLWGMALSFDGVNDYAVVTNVGYAVPTSEVTVEFWQLLTVTN